MQNNSKLVHRRQEVANRRDIKVEAARHDLAFYHLQDMVESTSQMQTRRQYARVKARWRGRESEFVWRPSVQIVSGDIHSNPFLEVMGGFMATGIMFSYYGSRREVCQMLQLLSHASRAYIVEQEGLPGFLVHKPSPLTWFTQLKAEGDLQEKVIAHKIENPEIFLQTLEVMENNEEREVYLKEHHPILFIEALKATERDDELKKFCKGLRNDYEHYTFYVEHYLLPWFESLRRDGRLKKGKKKIQDLLGKIVDYSGEILDGEKATGFGAFTDSIGTKFSGHFVDEMLEGAYVVIWHHGGRTEGEMRENMRHGKRTCHPKDGRMFNKIYINGKQIAQNRIKDKDESFYLAGAPHKAIFPNWTDFA